MTRPRGYLLDTDVLSETRKKKPAGEVIHWLNKAEPSELYVSVLALGELRKGVASKQRIDPDMARKLGDWVDGLEYSFADRILGVDAATTRIWGELSAEHFRPVVDTLLAATAVAQNLVLVTRNVDDVREIKVKVINPWLKQ